MIRTFIAIEIPEEIQKQVALLAGSLKGSGTNVRWVNQENIHLTLKFLGDVQEARIEGLARAVAEVTRGTAPFEVSLSVVGVFPSMRSPRIVWVGVGEGEEPIERLQKGIEENLARIGFPKEGRKYTPHITIGRVKSKRGVEELVAKLRQTSFSSEPFKVEGVTVFGSKLTPEGPVYTRLEEVKLSP